MCTLADTVMYIISINDTVRCSMFRTEEAMHHLACANNSFYKHLLDVLLENKLVKEY